MLDWQLLIIRDLFPGGRLRGEDNSCCVTRHNPLQLEHSDGDGEVELGQVQHQLDRNITWLCCQRGSWANRKEVLPSCDMDQTRLAKLPQEHNQDASCP